MDFKKRKLGHLGLERRVRPRADPEPEEVEDIESADDVTDNSEDNSDDEEPDSGSESSGGSEEGDQEEESESDEDEPPAIDTSSISFGALARAQASVSRPDRRRKSTKDTEDGDGGSSRDRQGRRDQDDGGGDKKKKAAKKAAAAALARANKHAPTEMPSTRQVSRRREVVSTGELGARRQARDPRFDPAVAHPGGRADERAYAFLDEYRESEMAQLRQAIKKAKNPYEKEQLQRALKSMEGKRDARKRVERERAVVEEHRRREKELVKQGKKPFYLKKSEQKKRLLLDRFADMSDKQVDKTIAKRRKKQAAKERMDMPVARRGME